MRVTVRYFAVLKDRRGLGSETLETSARTAGELAATLIMEHSLGLPPALVRIALGGTFVSDDHLLQEGDSVALIPPVAGG